MKGRSFIKAGRIYVKLPKYIGGWLRARYASPAECYAPVRLPETAHPAGAIIYKHLVANPGMRALTPRCISADMFDMDPETAPDDIRSGLPKGKCRDEYVPIAIPKAHFYMGRWIADGTWMQLGPIDAKNFIGFIEQEFWESFDEYIDDKKEYIRRRYPKRAFVFYDAILDFMELYCINIDDTDAMYRAAKRRKEAEKKRRVVNGEMF